MPDSELNPDQVDPEESAEPSPAYTEPPASDRPLAPGLYLVGTPIGNLEDITLRALRVLRQADRIACEDTRQTQKLLNHFAIKTPTLSLHLHNEHSRAAELIASLQSGAKIAVVSDAGMPGISDPGGSLTQAAISAGIPVFPIPGANAAVTALVASGLSTTSFQFHGFLPEKAGARRTKLEALASALSATPESNEKPTSLVFYEAPHRILETLSDLESVWGPTLPVVVARELTKLHEEFLRGPVSEVRANLAARDRVRGEITLLVEPRITKPGDPNQSPLTQSIGSQIEQLIRDGLTEKEALKQLARESGQSKSDLYRELQRTRAKSQNSNKRS